MHVKNLSQEPGHTEHKKHYPFLDIEHKISLLVFALLAIVGISLTFFINNSTKRILFTTESSNSLQISSFNPSYFGQKLSVPHTDNEMIVRYRPTVDIQAGSQGSSSFKPSDITGGIPQEAIDALKQIGVTSMEKVIKNASTTSTAAQTYISNIYKLTLSPGADLTAAMQAVCTDSSIEMYCEPNYKLSLATQPSSAGVGQLSTVATTGDPRGGKIALVDAPLPVGYNAAAQAMGMPSISQSQVMSGAEAPRTDQYLGHSLAIAIELFSVDSITPIIYAGACGDLCSNSDIANAIVYSSDNGAKVIYLGISGNFPQGVEPLSINSAVSYAKSKGAAVVIANINSSLTSYASQHKKLSLLEKFFSLLAPHKAFADPPAPPTSTCGNCSGTAPTAGSVANSLNTLANSFNSGTITNATQVQAYMAIYNANAGTLNQSNGGQQALTMLNASGAKAIEAEKTFQETQGGGLFALNQALQNFSNDAEKANTALQQNLQAKGDNSNPLNDVKGGLGGALQSAVFLQAKDINPGAENAQILETMAKGFSEETGTYDIDAIMSQVALLPSAPQNPDDPAADHNIPPPGSNTNGTGTGTGMHNGGLTTGSTNQNNGPYTFGGGQTGVFYNSVAGQGYPVGTSAITYNTPPAGTHYGSLAGANYSGLGSAYNAAPGSQFTVVGSAYGPNYGQTTMQMAANGAWQQVGFSYGPGQNPGPGYGQPAQGTTMAGGGVYNGAGAWIFGGAGGPDGPNYGGGSGGGNGGGAIDTSGFGSSAANDNGGGGDAGNGGLGL